MKLSHQTGTGPGMMLLHASGGSNL